MTSATNDPSAGAVADTATAASHPGLTLDSAPPSGRLYQFDEHYEVHNKLAEGSFGEVFVTTHRATGEKFAVKVINRTRLSPADNDNVTKEVAVLKDCRDVSNIVRLVDYYESPQSFYLVQLFAPGGDVFDRLAARTSYNEKVARDLAYNLVETMKVLHDRKIAHRDLKPENLLLKSLVDDSEILVADFGFAAYVPADGLKTRCGTPAFVSPEVLIADARYDERCDMWSVGCLLYMLIGGYPPFQAPNHRALFRKIRGADFCFHDQYWKNVSVSAKQLIASLLTTDPKYRCTASMALEKSSWLKMSATKLEGSDLSASLAEIRNFKARTSFKGAVHTVLWSVRNKFKVSDQTTFAKQVTDWNIIDEERLAGSNSDELTTIVRPTLSFGDVYELGGQLYEGRASTIWDCTHKIKGEGFAVKIVERNMDTQQGRAVVDTLLHEVAVLNSLDNEHILKIIDFFDEKDEYYLVMEKMNGGDVFDRILKKKKYTEKDAQVLARFLLEAVAYLHDRGICHRDLKPQNLLLKSQDDDAAIKVAGFGFACRVHTPQSLTKRYRWKPYCLLYFFRFIHLIDSLCRL
jgi:serine/threonine protein kinase